MKEGELEKDKGVGRGGRGKPEIKSGDVCHQSHGFMKELDQQWQMLPRG